VSAGGQLLRGLLDTGDWTLVNGMGDEVVTGGPFTRRDPATGNMSCLDLFIVSRELRPHVRSMLIDSKMEFTPSRAVKEKGVPKVIHSDHFSALLTLSNLPRVEEKVEKKKIWNFKKDGGWNRYQLLTDQSSEAFTAVIEDKELSIEEAMKKFDKIHNKIKFRAFGKVTVGRGKKQANDTEETLRQDNAAAVIEEQEKIASKEIEQIKHDANGKVGRVWEVRKRVIGAKKMAVEATAIINPKTNNLVVKRSQIKKVSLQYCTDTLANNKPEPEYEDIINKKKEAVNSILSEKDGEFKAEEDTFNQLLTKFKKSGKRNYDFLTKAGKEFQNVVYKFSQRMILEESFPSSFKETMLHMIFKGGKGKREILSDNRFIHSKSWFPRTVEGLVVAGGLKAPLVEGSSIFQIGGQSGHRVEELIFVMKSVIAKYRSEGKLLILQCYDLEKFFRQRNDRRRCTDVCEKEGRSKSHKMLVQAK
jgi:hypothetical protein